MINLLNDTANSNLRKKHGPLEVAPAGEIPQPQSATNESCVASITSSTKRSRDIRHNIIANTTKETKHQPRLHIPWLSSASSRTQR